jgi:hypothetical protein
MGVMRNGRGQRTMTITSKNIIFILLWTCFADKVLGQHFQDNPVYYEFRGHGEYVKVDKITDGHHTFYHSDKQTAIVGTFKNQRPVDYKAYIYDENGILSRIAVYKNYMYVGDIDNEGKLDSALIKSKAPIAHVDLTKQKGVLALDPSDQTDFITISSHGIVLTKQLDKTKFYRNEIKINISTGEVYFRKKSTGNFKLIEKVKNDSVVLYFKNSIRFERLDSIVKTNQYKVEVSFKIEFIDKGSYPTLPDPTVTKILEFGRPISDNKELETIISMYYKLKDKILN